MNNKQISREINVFNERIPPEEGNLVGYGALISFLKLSVPLPNQLSLISKKHKKYSNEGWNVFTPKYQPNETIFDHLVFALKYEGINLIVFKKLFEKLKPSAIEEWIKQEPLSLYCRKIWFLYEWLMEKKIAIDDLLKGNYILLVDEKLQYGAGRSINSKRHRIKNNMPGTVKFCPMIRKSSKLNTYINQNLKEETTTLIRKIHKDVLLRTSAFLLLKDSKASFSIEGENPTHNRASRWGRAISQAGIRPLSKNELYRLQQIIIDSSRFTKMGYREEGGFIGEHDRLTGEPIPEHISAKWQDIESLMNGLLNSAKKLEESDFPPVLTAAKIAFGFVYIHPFVDGNGRLHRYLIHHILSTMKYLPQGFIFPISAAMLEKIDDYRRILENYSHALLDLIKWEKTIDNNVVVLNNTIDFYRYFDATSHAEFLFDCLDYTIKKIIPEEVTYLINFDSIKNWLSDRFQMSDKTISLLIRFLEQNNGILSKRAREKEFISLTDLEVKDIESYYSMVMNKL